VTYRSRGKYQVAGLLGYTLNRRLALVLGYRYLAVDYRPNGNAGFIYDVAIRRGWRFDHQDQVIAAYPLTHDAYKSESVIQLAKTPIWAPGIPTDCWMTRMRSTFLKCVFLVCFACLPAYAQNVQFLPEVDAHLKLNSSFRAYLEAKNDRDGGDPHQFGIGPSIQLYLKPLVKLKEVTKFDLDDTKSRFLVLETGTVILRHRMLLPKIVC
jgi:hypothetical protein